MQQQEVDILRVRGVESDDFLKVEHRGMEPVPEAERHGSPRELALVWGGAMANYVSLLTGALVIGAPLALGFSQGQLGLLLGRAYFRRLTPEQNIGVLNNQNKENIS